MTVYTVCFFIHTRVRPSSLSAQHFTDVWQRVSQIKRAASLLIPGDKTYRILRLLHPPPLAAFRHLHLPFFFLQIFSSTSIAFIEVNFDMNKFLIWPLHLLPGLPTYLSPLGEDMSFYESCLYGVSNWKHFFCLHISISFPTSCSPTRSWGFEIRSEFQKYITLSWHLLLGLPMSLLSMGGILSYCILFLFRYFVNYTLFLFI